MAPPEQYRCRRCFSLSFNFFLRWNTRRPREKMSLEPPTDVAVGSDCNFEHTIPLTAAPPRLYWPWSTSVRPRSQEMAARERLKLPRSVPPHCILLSACLSHSLHPLYSYRRHVTSFAPLRGPANQRARSLARSFLPVTSLGTATARVFFFFSCRAQAAAPSRLLIQSAFVAARKVHAFYDLISCVCCVNLNNSPIQWCF